MATDEPGPGRALQECGTNQNAGGKPEAAAPAAAPAPAADQATPSYTACANSTEQGKEAFQPLLRGIDSLYLSYQGKLSEETEKRLADLRDLARSVSKTEQAKAQLKSGEHLFEVLDKGSGFYPFGLADHAFRIRIASRAAVRIPAASVQVSSAFLATVGIDLAVKRLQDVLRELLSELGREKVSRADLFCDFTTAVNLDGIGRDDWVSRAEEIHTYSLRRKLSGWTVGLGGPVAARLYNKTLEIEEHSHKYYFHELWENAGWIPTDEVWRLEFELKRSALKEFGISSLDDLRRASGSLWRYVSTEWLRLTVPNAEDETRTRWPTHPLWTALQGVEWGGNDPLTKRPMRKNRAPEDDWYLSHASSLHASFMAREGISDPTEGWRQLMSFLRDLVASYPERYGIDYDGLVQEKVSVKQRQYNTGLNVDREPGEDDEAAAIAYRRASKGG